LNLSIAWIASSTLSIRQKIFGKYLFNSFSRNSLALNSSSYNSFYHFINVARFCLIYRNELVTVN
jgi:hypothetical protein